MDFSTMYNPPETIKVVIPHDSKVVPDMSYTPREILGKFSRGERVPLGFQGLFDSEDDPEDDRYNDDISLFEDDPTRDPEFDFGDYVEEKHALEQRMKERKSAQRKKDVAKSKRKASEDESSVSEMRMRETTSEDGATPPEGSTNK